MSASHNTSRWCPLNIHVGYVYMCLQERDGLEVALQKDKGSGHEVEKLKSQRVRNLNVVFLADRTNGRAYATVLRLSSSVCNVMYCG